MDPKSLDAKQARKQAREERHGVIAGTVDAVLDAIAEQVHDCAGSEPKPARERLLVLLEGFLAGERPEERADLMHVVKAALLSVAERTHPAPSEARPARDELVRLLQVHDDENAKNRISADEPFPTAR